MTSDPDFKRRADLSATAGLSCSTYHCRTEKKTFTWLAYECIEKQEVKFFTSRGVRIFARMRGSCKYAKITGRGEGTREVTILQGREYQHEGR